MLLFALGIRRPPALGIALIAAGLLAAGPARAYDVNERFSIGGVLAAAGQCQEVSARLPGEGYGFAEPDSDPLVFATPLDSFGNACRGGLPVQLELDFHPNERHQVFIALGWAGDNALNPISPFRLAPWAADLEADVRDINGSSRDYLLQAWYRYAHPLGGDDSIAGTFGIIDSTAYLDQNEYANDEYTQFMNEAFVNAGTYNLPAYDAGAALEARLGAFSLNAVGMNIHENDDGYNDNFWGVQAGWHPQLALGPGNYRVNLMGTSRAFLSPPWFRPPTPMPTEADGEAVDAATPAVEEELRLVDGQVVVEEPGRRESRLAWGLSFDQALGESVGVFLRLAWQNTDAAVDYEALYSGGLSIQGKAWQRPQDSIGLGYAYLEGGNLDVRRTNVFEGYYRAVLNDVLAVTADVQYMSDALVRVDPLQRDPAGWIFGLRLTAAF